MANYVNTASLTGVFLGTWYLHTIVKPFADAEKGASHGLNIFEDLGGDFLESAGEIVDDALKGVAKAKYAFVKLSNKAKDLIRFKTNPLKNTKYSEKVQQQMSRNDYHAFSKEGDNWAGIGKQSTITGGDGLSRIKVELSGEFRGKSGHFEWIIEANNEISHRLYVPQIH